jgi:hypothetical protein
VSALALLVLLPFILCSLRIVLTVAGWLVWLLCILAMLALTLVLAGWGLRL